MANNYDSSLLGFLQKKSLFSNTQNNISRKRSRSRSKESRGGFDQRSNVNTFDDRSIDQPITQNKQPMFNYQPTSPKNQPIIQQKPYTFNIDNTNKPYMDNNSKKVQQNAKYQDIFTPFQDNAAKSYASNNNRSIGNSSVKNNPVENQQLFSSFNANPTTPNNGNSTNPFHILHTTSNTFNSSTANNFNIPNSSNISNGANMNKPYEGSFRLQPAFQQPQYKNYQTTSELRGDRYRQDDRTSVVSKRFDDRPIQNQIWTGLVSHSNSFESARLESVQCLDNLSGKIGQQISNINYKIQAFNSRMAKALNSQFKNIRDRITQIFEAAFRQSEKFIKEYMRYKQQQLAGQLMKIREMLIRQNAKIQTMKEQLKRPQWRKVAGQILSSELEKKVEEVLIKSRDSGVGQWELGDIAGQHIKNIELQLKQIIKIQPGTIK